MKLDFLQQFDKRMKSVGAYALLFKNSMQKGTWKQYGFEQLHEQVNLLFSVLLFIMEQSLKEEICTMDDIGTFIDEVNMQYYRKPLSYSQCKELAEFIIDVILCDEGRAMYFQGFHYETSEYKEIHINFVENSIVYIEEDIRRTSYRLTNDGYSLMLSTLEIESNMKLTIHEMIFKLHLEKASYDKAADDVKKLFSYLRMQIQKTEDAMRKIKHNALNYSVEEYKELLTENLGSLEHTNGRFEAHKKLVAIRVQELEEKDINIKKLDQKERDNLANLKIIEGYLNRSLDELQRLMITHFDFKSLYTKELETISKMTYMKRFNFRSEVYEKVLQNLNLLDHMDTFLRPLFGQPLEKTYNLNKAIQYQRSILSKEDDEEEVLTFDEELWEEEQREKMQLKLQKYQMALGYLLELAYEKKGISLKEIKEIATEAGMVDIMIPNVEIFKEVMIELLKNKQIDVDAIRKEREENVFEQPLDFQINQSILNIANESSSLKTMKSILTHKLIDGEQVEFKGVQDENGVYRNILCSNVWIQVE